jgi:hypothetical protein
MVMAISRAILAVFIGVVLLSSPAAHALSPIGIVKPQPAPTEPDTRRPTVCTEQYAPVCGRLNNVVKTFPNQCYARAAGAEIIALGPCGGQIGPRDPQ